MSDNTPACPPLGTGSIDFDAVQAAAKRGDDLAEAINQAREGGPPEPAPETLYEPEVEKVLADMTKPELLDLAAAEGVDLTGASNNEDRAAAIQSARDALAGVPGTPGTPGTPGI